MNEDIDSTQCLDQRSRWGRRSSPADPVPLTEKAAKGQLSCEMNESVTAPGENHQRIRLKLWKAKRYSFWIEQHSVTMRGEST